MLHYAALEAWWYPQIKSEAAKICVLRPGLPEKATHSGIERLDVSPDYMLPQLIRAGSGETFASSLEQLMHISDCRAMQFHELFYRQRL